MLRPGRVRRTCRPNSSEAGRAVLSAPRELPTRLGILPEPAHQASEQRTIPTRVGNTFGGGLGSGLRADHPHAGGEYPDGFGIVGGWVGPSPRGWGILRRDAVPQLRRRTIPTRVGNTTRRCRRRTSHADHPHAGGEYNLQGKERIHWAGPSPRGWGIRRGPRLRFRIFRTIPTRVGNTSSLSSRLRLTADHPHAGGEYRFALQLRASDDGPSPRGWGIRRARPPIRLLERTIPTRVGNTSVDGIECGGPADHPHAGGEYPSSASHISSISGPSPRGWGIHSPRLAELENWRTIPTRVGNTDNSPTGTQKRTDHPHAGGEYHGPEPHGLLSSGPSPRGWGILLGASVRQIIPRTIPTRVGNTRASTISQSLRPDHPHAGGEYPMASTASGVAIGPSPRGWGIRGEPELQ